MLFLVRLDVHIPHELPAAQADEIKAREKAYALDLQRDGRWRHLWRVVGEYANYSVFDVASNDELHQLLSALPEEKRTALLLFEVEGFSVQEIADITGEPRGTVLARLSRTRTELQKELRSGSGEEGAAPADRAQGRKHV
jgi:muconolactone D-isomerase